MLAVYTTGQEAGERSVIVLQWRVDPAYEIGGVSVGALLSQFESGV